MASLANMLVAQGLETSKPTSFGDAFKVGADLAMQQEKLKQNQQELNQKLRAAKDAGRDKFVDYLFKAQAIKDPAARTNYMKSAPTVRAMWQVSPEEFSDEAIESLSKSDEDSGRAYTLALDVQNPNSPIFGRTDVALQMYNDPQQRILIPVTPPELRAGGEDFNVADAAKNYLNYKGQQEQIAAAKSRQDTEIASTGSKEVAKKTADSYAAYTSNGGRAGLEKNIERYEEAIRKLENNEVVLGTVAKKLPYGSHEAVLSRTDPAAKALFDDVLSGVNMRAALADPNPTERQVEAIKAMTIDGRLSNAANIKKLQTAITAMKKEAADKEKQFQQQGFDVSGGTSAPRTPPQAVGKSARTLAELDVPAKQEFLRKTIADYPNKLKELAAAYGVTETQFKRLIGVP